jgi:hypothetical protein
MLNGLSRLNCWKLAAMLVAESRNDFMSCPTLQSVVIKPQRLTKHNQMPGTVNRSRVGLNVQGGAHDVLILRWPGCPGS